MVINAECGKTVRIAYQGENKRQKVRFDLADIMTEFPGGTAVLAILRNGDDTVVPASMTEMDGTSLLWTVTAWECEHDGFLYAQVTYATADGVVAKDKKYRFDIKDSLIVGGVEPETWEDYVGQLVTAAAGVNDAISSAMDTLDAKVADAQAAQNAAEIAQGKAEDAQAAAEAAVGQYDDMTAEAEGLAAGEDPTAEIDHMGDHPVLKLGIPAGEKGDPGDPGDPGAPGYSPVAVVTKSGKVATITLIDKNGTTSAQISDGEDGTTAIDDTAGAGDTDKTFSADKLTAMDSELKNAINGKPGIKDSTKTGVDLDVSDSQGNVILRIADGHIKTKNFDSETGRTDIIKNSTKTGVDLDFSDSQGNVVLRLKNGNICTKWFSSENADGSVDYNADVVYTNTEGTKAITADFHSGDEIVMHFSNASDRIAGLIKSDKVTYKYTDASNTDHTLGTAYGYDYPVYKFPEDATAISVTYGAGLLWGENGTLRFSVYKKGITERKPHLISVASDGSKDYTSVRDAIDSITDNNAYNKYRIEIYPGTYDIISYYTAEEIGQTGFQGLFVGDGVSLVGVGQKDNIILTGALDTNVYSSTKRNDISVINIAGTASIENMTINAENMRYCIHDDTGPMTHQTAIKEIIDCVLNAKNMTTGAIAYGCGISNMRKLHLKNCIFNEELHIHTHDTGTYSPSVLIENCEARVFSFADYNSTVNIEYSIMNCKFSLIRSELVHTPHNQFLFINQIGGTNPIVDCETGMIYNLSNCIKAKGQISAGQLVNVNRISRQMTATAVSSANIASGVSIGYTGNETVVASGGYINSNQVGLTGLSQGDFITIDSDGVLISGGTSSNAVGVVTSISERQDGGAYIKLFV